jgi:hypothetical protein
MRELPIVSSSSGRWYDDTRDHLAGEHGVEAAESGPNLLLAMSHGEAHIHGTFADGKEPHRHLPNQ